MEMAGRLQRGRKEGLLAAEVQEGRGLQSCGWSRCPRPRIHPSQRRRRRVRARQGGEATMGSGSGRDGVGMGDGPVPPDGPADFASLHVAARPFAGHKLCALHIPRLPEASILWDKRPEGSHTPCVTRGGSLRARATSPPHPEVERTSCATVSRLLFRRRAFSRVYIDWTE
jgi:hypothetical protein